MDGSIEMREIEQDRENPVASGSVAINAVTMNPHAVLQLKYKVIHAAISARHYFFFLQSS
jgi:hypothetical protein